jgi:hypothetical protein
MRGRGAAAAGLRLISGIQGICRKVETARHAPAFRMPRLSMQRK